MSNVTSAIVRTIRMLLTGQGGTYGSFVYEVSWTRERILEFSRPAATLAR